MGSTGTDEVTAGQFETSPQRRWGLPSDDGGRRSGRLVVPCLTALVVVVAVLWVWAARVTAPGDGTMTFPSIPRWTSDGVSITDVLPEASGLQVGDCVIAINDIPIADLGTGRAQLAPDQLRPGTVVQYQVVRQSEPMDLSRCAGEQLSVPVVIWDYPIGSAVARHLAGLPLLVLMLMVASFVLRHRIHDPAAQALFVVAAVVPLGVTSWPLGSQIIDLANGPRLWPLLVGELANTLVWGGLLHFALVFPSPPAWLARRPWVVPGAYLVPVLTQVAFLAIALPRTTEQLDQIGLLVGFSRTPGASVPALLVAAFVVGYRNTRDPSMRARLRWVLYSILGSAALYLGLGQIPNVLTGRPLIALDWEPIIFLPFPLVLGAAVLRYNLFDIDVMVRRSLVYLLVAVTGAAIYLGSGIVLNIALGERQPLILLALAGLVVLGVQPLLRRTRRRLSRMIFGARDDPSEVLGRLSDELAATATPEAILPAIVETLTRTLRLRHVAIELDLPDGSVEQVSRGDSRRPDLEVPLQHQGEQVGRLVLSAAPGREPFGSADRRLIDSLVGQLSVTVYNVLLQRQVRRSLERVVTAREEERRRLRRDIHDGVGPTLAAGTMRLQLARTLLPTDPTKSAQLLDEVCELQRRVTRDVRELVEGLRPPVLDQLGLPAALRSQAAILAGGHDATPLRIDIDAPGTLPLPAAVEVATYRIVLEALNNVRQHAHATTAHVRLWTADSALLVQVSDDGVGLPPRFRAGVGLHSMRERATELGGSCIITPAAEGGTTVLTRLPIHPTAGARQ